MVRIVALVLALPQLAAFASAARSAALSVSGTGVRVGDAGSAHLSDVSIVLARLLGLDVVAAPDASVPITSDLFARPRACVVLALEGVGLEDLSEQDAPNLKAAFEAHVLPLAQTGAAPRSKLTSALSYKGAPLSSLLAKQLPGAQMLAAGGDLRAVRDVRSSRAQLPREGQDELSTILSAVSERLKPISSTTPEGPNVIVLTVSEPARADAKRGAGAFRSALARVDAALPQLLAAANAANGGRMVATILLLGDAEPSTRRALQASGEAANATSVAFYSTNEVADYLLITWTAVGLALVLIVILICVPWSGELDPILYASLGKDDGKKDM